MSQLTHLTERDIKLIIDVYKYRYLSTSQIQTLYFPSRQTANRRMRLLIQAGYINGYNAPAIEDRIVYLTSKGANLVASTLEVPYESLGFKRIADTAKDYYFLRHFLGINDFRISLNLALNAQTELGLSGFIPEYYGEKTSKGGTIKYIRDLVCDIKAPETLINYTPDGVFALEKNNRTALFFLEIDRGTEVLSNPEKGFSKAINFYYNYFISKKFQRYHEDFKCEPFRGFRVLFVTTTEIRLENMREALSKAGHQEHRFIWLTTTNKTKPETMFQPIWNSLDINDANLYRIG